MKILFMGTPDFAAECLKSIYNSKHNVCAVFCQPDKPKGRKQVMTAPPVKVFAEEKGIVVHQPKTLRCDDSIKIINDSDADIIVVVAYGKILPKEILKIPRFGCINVHASLLPKYRGAAPIQWAIINGEKKTGVTTMYMNEGLDTGDIILSKETDIRADETSGELFTRLAPIGAGLLLDTLACIEEGNVNRVKQLDSDATYAPILDKSYSTIDWNKPANAIHNMIRGLNPWPAAVTTLDAKNLKIYRSSVSKHTSSFPGEIVSTKPFVVGCGDNTALEISEVQAEGKKRMNINDFLHGYNIGANTVLGR